MQLGICTTDFPVQSPESLMNKIKNYGLSQVQFSFASIGEDELPATLSKNLIRRIHQAINDNNLELVAINGTFNMIHPDLSERHRGIVRFPLLAKVACLLDCRIITLCTGTNDPDNMWRFHPENETEQSWRNLIATLEELLPIAEKNEIYLGIEPEASNVVSTPERARRLLDELCSPWLKIVMDCANIFPKNTARPDLVRPMMKKAFDYLGPYVILAHGKDILSSDDILFTTPGKGIVDYDYFLDLLQQYQYEGGFILHGIRSEEEIPGCVAFMREKISQIKPGTASADVSAHDRKTLSGPTLS